MHLDSAFTGAYVSFEERGNTPGVGHVDGITATEGLIVAGFDFRVPSRTLD
jgi:hypothetical protein